LKEETLIKPGRHAPEAVAGSIPDSAAELAAIPIWLKMQQTVKDLLKLKPEISICGRVLIRHYIKFVDIIARIIDGLLKVGLNIE
jgi:hypothetical protein